MWMFLAQLAIPLAAGVLIGVSAAMAHRHNTRPFSNQVWWIQKRIARLTSWIAYRHTSRRWYQAGRNTRKNSW